MAMMKQDFRTLREIYEKTAGGNSSHPVLLPRWVR